MKRLAPIYLPPIHLRLRDDTEVLMRSISPGDKPLFIQGLRELSPQSIYYRFNSSAFKLSSGSLDYFTEVDQIDHVAIGVGLESDSNLVLKGLGIGRYIRMKDNPEEAELALTVIDAYQRQGVGTMLLAGLSECARQQGIRYFLVHIHAVRRELIQRLTSMEAEVINRRSNVLELALPVPSENMVSARAEQLEVFNHHIYQKIVPRA